MLPLLLSAVPSMALAQQDEVPLSKSCPDLTPEEIEGIENYKGMFAENALYARAYCVPVEEAERRMEIQNRGAIGPATEPGGPAGPPPDSIAYVNQQLQENEADTLAGLWIRHEPDYRVMVAFTRDGPETLAEYTDDPLFLAINRPGPTLVEARAKQESFVEDLNRLGVNWSGAGYNEATGRLEVTLAGNGDPVRAAAARGEIDLPDWIDLVEPDPFPISAPPPAVNAERVKAYPQIGHRTDMYMSTLVGLPDIRATLTLRNGCLMLDTDQGSYVGLWQQHNSLDLSDPNRITILNRFNGSRIAPGDELALTGIQPDGNAIRTADQVPDLVGTSPACPGPYWLVNGYQPWADHAAAVRNNRIADIMREEGVSRSRAAELYDIDMARVPVLTAWRDRMFAEQGDKVAEIGIDERSGTAHMFHVTGSAPESLIPAGLDDYVSHQTVPMGRARLFSEKAMLDAALDTAGLEATTEAEFFSGRVRLTPADPRALSEAAVAGRVAFPPLTMVQLPGAPAVNEYYEGRPDWYQMALRHLEAAPDFAEIRALIEAGTVPGFGGPPPPPASTSSRTPGVNQDNHEDRNPPRIMTKATRAQSLDIAHFMVALGFSAEDIAALRAVGIDPVHAWVDKNGYETPENNAILMQEIAIAEPVAIDRDDVGSDGFRSTVTMRILEPLKGELEAGDEVRVRFASGDFEEGSYAQGHDEPILLPGLPNSLDDGSRWLVRLSRPFYDYIARANGGPDAPRDAPLYVANGEMREIIDGAVQLGAIDKPPVPLTDYRATVAEISAAFDRAGVVIGD